MTGTGRIRRRDIVPLQARVIALQTHPVPLGSLVIAIDCNLTAFRKVHKEITEMVKRKGELIFLASLRTIGLAWQNHILIEIHCQELPFC